MKNNMINKIEIDGFEIQIWISEFANPQYVAVNMTTAIEMLEGYDLTELEKTDVTELMAGYCRLVDEAGLNGFGDTEFEALTDLFSHATLVDKE